MHWKIADQYSLATVESHKLSERLGDVPSWSTIVKGEFHTPPSVLCLTQFGLLFRARH